MRKVTEVIAEAFKNGSAKRNTNTSTDGVTFYLHGNAIARKENGRLEISMAGWPTNTTCERLNGILSVYGSVFRVGRKNRSPMVRNVQNGQETLFPSNAWQAVGDAKA